MRQPDGQDGVPDEASVNRSFRRCYEHVMGRTATVMLSVLVMAAIIVTVDVLFLRHHVWLRLLVNVGIVLVFAAVYFRYRNRL